MIDSSKSIGSEQALDPNILLRSLRFSVAVRRRSDDSTIKVIRKHSNDLVFDPIEELTISQAAWDHVQKICDLPSLVFAHPDLIKRHPRVSQHYRGITLLSRKQVQQATRAQVAKWEDEEPKSQVSNACAFSVACLYNSVISSIIESSSNWTLEDGYRNILATMGMTFEGVS